MILTKQLLEQWDDCQEGIDFCERNKLFGFDLDRFDEIKGDYTGFISWVRSELNIKKEYDSKGNIIKEERSNGTWTKWEYDERENIIKEEKNSSWEWLREWEYDSHGNKIKKKILMGVGLNGNMILMEIK